MRIISGASNGLSHLHSNGIIHSNIKASNVMIDGDFTPKASFHNRFYNNLIGSTIKTEKKLRHIENNHVEKNPDSENVRWWALELFHDPIVSFAKLLHHFSPRGLGTRTAVLGRKRIKPASSYFTDSDKYLEFEFWFVYKRN